MAFESRNQPTKDDRKNNSKQDSKLAELFLGWMR